MRTRARRDAGVSLIEALVALAVMGFGMLGVVGMQVTMRANSEAAKQRAEAVRIAQAAAEDWRTFDQLDNPSAVSTVVAFDSITGYVDQAANDFISTGALANTNTAFTVTGTVSPAVATPNEPLFKTVTLAVNWSDRAGQSQSVKLVSAIAGVAPALSAAVAFPGDRAVTARPKGRNPNVPLAAVDLGNGSSSFVPPGAPAGVTWRFDNTTGVLVTCATTTCGSQKYFLLSGYIRFATDSAPSAALAESPQSFPVDVAVHVSATAPAVADIVCYVQAVSDIHTPQSPLDGLPYFCAMPISTSLTSANRWSGRSYLVDGVGVDIATTADPASSSRRRICRYTPEASDTPHGGNVAHPLNYTDVAGPLTNQNFLVIRAGDGSSTAYACPTDPTVTGNTYRHQPLS